MSELTTVINDIVSKLEKWDLHPGAIVGFDGYVDMIKKVIQNRDGDMATYFPNITAFSERIAFAAGKSAQIEVTQEETKLGGNAPIMANALSCLGFDTTCIGMLGKPDLHPVFESMSAHKISLGEPAETTALEFGDGKIMLSDLTTFQNLRWEELVRIIPLEKLVEIFDKASLIAMVDWSNLPHAVNLLSGIASNILPLLSSNHHIFFDLADPTRKPTSEILELLQIMGRFSEAGVVTLGLNKNEAWYLYEILFEKADESMPLDQIGRQIFKQLNVDQLMIHPLDCSLIFTKKNNYVMPGRIVEEPVIQTGAGDNLNAGFCLGHLLDLELKSCLVLGMATSGAYVSLGHSPSIEDLIVYLNAWGKALA